MLSGAVIPYFRIQLRNERRRGAARERSIRIVVTVVVFNLANAIVVTEQRLVVQIRQSRCAHECGPKGVVHPIVVEDRCRSPLRAGHIRRRVRRNSACIDGDVKAGVLQHASAGKPDHAAPDHGCTSLLGGHRQLEREERGLESDMPPPPWPKSCAIVLLSCPSAGTTKPPARSGRKPTVVRVTRSKLTATGVRLLTCAARAAGAAPNAKAAVAKAPVVFRKPRRPSILRDGAGRSGAWSSMKAVLKIIVLCLDRFVQMLRVERTRVTGRGRALPTSIGESRFPIYPPVGAIFSLAVLRSGRGDQAVSALGSCCAQSLGNQRSRISRDAATYTPSPSTSASRGSGSPLR